MNRLVSWVTVMVGVSTSVLKTVSIPANLTKTVFYFNSAGCVLTKDLIMHRNLFRRRLKCSNKINIFMFQKYYTNTKVYYSTVN